MGWLPVLDGGKPHQPIPVHIHSQRVAGRDKDVNSEVKLESINKKWLERQRKRCRDAPHAVWPYLGNVLLYHTVFTSSDLLQTAQ